VDAALTSLEKTGAPDIKADQLKRKLQDLLRRAKELEKTPTPKGGTPEQKKLLADFAAWEREYGDWLKTSGKLYGRT